MSSLDIVAASASSDAFLRHNGQTGKWTCDSADLDPDDLWCFAGEFSYGWKYLEAGKPSEDYPEVPGQPFKQRHELPYHQDEKEWPFDLVKGPDGKKTKVPRDPVRQYIRAPLIRVRDGLSASFEAMPTSARGALTKLARNIRWQSAGHNPAAKPVLKLGTRPFQSQYGKAFAPVFGITGWAMPGEDGLMRLEGAGDQPSLSAELNDKLPW